MASKTKQAANKARKALLDRAPKDEWDLSPKNLLSSGYTPLNLAITDTIHGAYPKGSYIFYVGGSSSGKTWLTLTAFAEASISKHFKGYRYVYDSPEFGAMMNISKYFGPAVADRIEHATKDGPSRYADEFYYNVDDRLKAGDPFIYVLDSMDALLAREDDEFFERKKRAAKGKGEEGSGSYGVQKAKINSQYLKRLLRGLKDSGSILFVISQTRKNIGFGAKFNPDTRAGGESLKFYASVELWTKVIGKLTSRKIRGKERQVGVETRIACKKNRISGKDRTVVMPIHWSHGIDDLGGCVDYLIDEEQWSINKKVINASDFDMTGKREQLVRKIESQGMESDLRALVGDVWAEIEEACAIKRKPRYGQETEDESEPNKESSEEEETET